MPTDVDAKLVYGYDLGGPDRWNLRGVDDGMDPDLSWWEPGDPFPECVQEELDAHRRDEGVDLVGVDLHWYGSDTRHGIGVGYILGAGSYFTYYDQALTLSVDFPPGRMVEGAMARRLGHALDILGIQPRTAGPRWILAASHGI